MTNRTGDGAVVSDCPVVAIGASAGGLDALKRFFGAITTDGDVAYVVVTHRAVDSVSVLDDILGRITTLPVAEAKDGAVVTAGHVYLSPSSHSLRIEHGRLLFHEIAKDRSALPIDFFFRSLADDKAGRAICVLLSGTGSDGTLGLQAVKGDGGMAIAQDLRSAAFTDMPSSAIASGLVDYVVPPEDMPAIIAQYVKGLTVKARKRGQHLVGDDALDEILAVLRRRTGSDFSTYKVNTLQRRIERRMNVHHLNEAWDYLRYLQDNDHETSLLFKELLIGVTAFFRDNEAFAALEQALEPILAAKANDETVRIWTPGCSTGEEPYSMAMLMREYMDRSGKTLNVQIFATDLDDSAINFARAGLYSDGIALDVSEDRLEKHFVREGHHYRIRKSIREMVIFATQNLVQDPSFTKLDLVSCRNLLIYLDAQTQKKILPLFHYSLKPGGLLFLGSSETVGAFGDIFTPLHVRWKIFARREAPVSSLRLARMAEPPRLLDATYQTSGSEKRMPDKSPNIQELAQRALMMQLVPPSVIINEKGDVFYIHGRTGMYLEPAPGQSQKTQNLFEMARQGLELPLISLVRRATAQVEEIVHKGVVVQGETVPYLVNLRARKIDSPEALRGLIWVTFDKEDDPAAIEAIEMPTAAEGEALERELRFVKENLRNTIEELETSNEQIKSVNEELQSTNEELQSANEELETSKEEMQSLNEELQTVNEELENKVRDLAFANDDMKNLLNNTGIATLFLDNDLRIKRFTEQAKKIINLIVTDAGRPISDIVTQLDYKNLTTDAAEVLQTLVFKEIEVRAYDWSWYLARIMPYRTADNVIDGLAITFVDITRLKRSEILLAANIKALSMMSIEQAALNRVLDEILLTIQHQTPDIWCAVALTRDGHLHNASAPTLPAAFNDVLDGIEIREDSDEPCAHAAAALKHIIVPDLAAIQPPTAFSQLALDHDIKAAWSQPIFDTAKHLVGVFTIYYLKAHRPSDMEEALVNQAVPLMGLAISQSRRRETS
jgi:two-component system CheB/CheR fusion protein